MYLVVLGNEFARDKGTAMLRKELDVLSPTKKINSANKIKKRMVL